MLQQHWPRARPVNNEKASKEFGKGFSICFIYFNLHPVTFSLCIIQKKPQDEIITKNPQCFGQKTVFVFKAGEALTFASSTRVGVSSSMAVLGGTLGSTAGGICGALAGGAVGVVSRP